MAGAPASPVEARRARLARMRAWATGLLLLMAALFVGASLLQPRLPALAWVRAFAEAALVGACADWFAVTALFRRPLGLPIPHTAIIPRAKDRIGEALGRFIVENFLSPRSLDARLKSAELAAWGGSWLRRPDRAQAVAQRVVALGPALAGGLPGGALEELAGAAALAAARAVPAAPTASALLAAVWDEGRAQPLVERAAALLAEYLQANQEVILEKVQQQSWRWMPTFVDRAITKRITAGLAQLLIDVQDPGHPWRTALGEEVERWIARLAADPELRAQGEALKARLLDDPRLRAHAHRLWQELAVRMEAGWGGGAEALSARLAALLQALGGWLEDDPTVQRALNRGARVFVRRVLAPRRHAIGRYVAETVAGWDARAMVERLELQVGPDLQFIRVNGTVVGGLVGLALYAVSRMAGWG